MLQCADYTQKLMRHKIEGCPPDNNRTEWKWRCKMYMANYNFGKLFFLWSIWIMYEAGVLWPGTLQSVELLNHKPRTDTEMKLKINRNIYFITQQTFRNRCVATNYQFLSGRNQSANWVFACYEDSVTWVLLRVRTNFFSLEFTLWIVNYFVYFGTL